ncbi:MAG: hypothetical protein ACP5MH_11225, partial [Thermoproteus sp.]
MKWALVLLAIAAVASAQIVFWMPQYVGHGIAMGNLSNLVFYDPTVVGGNHYDSLPGVVASPWTPDGGTVQYVYKTAMALFQMADIDVNKSVVWRLWEIHQGMDIYRERPVTISYGLQVAVKLGPGPPLGNMTPTDTYYQYPSGLSVQLWKFGPYENGPEVDIVSVSYVYAYDGSRGLCMSYLRFRQKWYYDWDYLYLFFSKPGLYMGGECIKNATMAPPRNITITTERGGVAIYVDGRRIWYLNTTRWSNETPWLYTGPYGILVSYLTTAQAFITTNYPADAVQPLGRVWLFIGNDTLAPPKYVATEGMYALAPNMAGYLQASVSFDGLSVFVGPGVTTKTLIAETPEVEISLFGRPASVLRGALLKCQFGQAVVRGNITPFFPGVYLVLGPGSFACTEYPVVVRTVAGVYVVPAAANSTFVWTPPDEVVNGTRYKYRAVSVYVTGPVEVEAEVEGVEHRVALQYPWGEEVVWASGNLSLPGRFVDLGNGTAYRIAPVEVAVEGPTTVRPNYTKLYRVVYASPAGTNATWVVEGTALSLGPEFVDLGNGTAWALEPALLKAEEGAVSAVYKPAPALYIVRGPVTVYFSGTRLYKVVVRTPLGVNETWVAAGSTIRVSPPQRVYLGNGTMLEGPSGGGEYVVERPLNITVSYAARLYWVSVRTPVNSTEGWMPRGYVLSFPPVVDLGNGTRL